MQHLQKIKAEMFVILVADDPGEMHECVSALFCF